MRTEIVTTLERSRLMARVRQEGTSAEIAVRKALDDLCIEYEVNAKDLPGSPDLVNKDHEWAIFVHGCFWHAHEDCSRWKIPSKNREYWEEKFKRNKERALDFREGGRGDVFDPHKRLITPSCEIHIGFLRLGRVGLNGFTQPINMG